MYIYDILTSLAGGHVPLEIWVRKQWTRGRKGKGALTKLNQR